MRIVFLDLDGTLLKDDKTISARDINALHNFHNKGILIGYITSRTKRRINEIIKDLPCDFLATYNGALVEISMDNKTIINSTIDKSIAYELIDQYLNQPHCDVYAYFEPYYLMNHTISDQKRTKVMKYNSFSRASLPECQRVRCRFEYGVSQTSIDHTNIKVYFENNDIVFESVMANKGYAVKRILDYYNIPSDNAIAIGDSDADIDMFLECHTSVAMMNSSDYVKKNATMVTLSNNNSGVSTALFHIFNR